MVPASDLAVPVTVEVAASVLVAVSSRLVPYQIGHCNMSRGSSRVILGVSHPASSEFWCDSKNVQKALGKLGKASADCRA